ncbi:MAG TPA: HAD-IC family P-type ATPase, partial [Clostridia bacterium]|nr:HAD-IC family P-type ATPase [Clostridia bacterium]
LAFSLCRLSTHPASARIVESFPPGLKALPVQDFTEVPGCGITGVIGSHQVKLGSRSWLESQNIHASAIPAHAGSSSYLAIDNQVAGAFLLSNELRPDADRLLADLSHHHELTLLSGDNEKERTRFEPLFGPGAQLRFNQTPLDKLEFIQNLQESGKTVMMVGDGLNDAGALKQSDVGIAVVEKAGAFSPGSDVILSAHRVPALSQLLQFSRQATRIVRLGFGISALYNAAGISIAAAGVLSPLICAILMPLSSVSVVLFASGATHWAAKRTRIL